MSGSNLLRHGIAGAVAALLIGGISGCGGTSNRNTDPKPVAEELSVLVSAMNGLYYPPFLRQKPAGPEDNSYALRIRSVLGETPRLSLSKESVGFFHDEAVAASPLQGRAWLAPMMSANAPALLTDGDLDAVRAMRTEDGWFSGPGMDSSGLEGRASATADALEVLRSRGSISTEDRHETLRWLQAVSTDRPGQAAAADLARSFSLLDLPIPPSLKTLGQPPKRNFAELAGPARYDLLVEAYRYASLVQQTGGIADLDPTVWASVLRHNADNLGYRDLYYLVVVARAAGAPMSAFQAVQTRIAENLLPDGTIRDPTAYVGSPEATLYGLRLRALAGEATTDPRLADSLNKAFVEHQQSAGAPERLTAGAALHLAGITGQAGPCQAAGAVPTTVRQDNAEVWSRAVLACGDLGGSVPEPRIDQWPLGTAEGVVAAAAVVTSLNDSGHGKAIPAWISADRLREWAISPERVPSTSGYAVTTRAYLLLGGQLDEPLRNAIRRGIDERRGCSQLPSLYHADGLGPVCDLKATWAVWKLKLLTDGKLP